MDEDEFGDFGGFEAAEPAGERQAAQLPAQVSPWAAFASGSAHDRPDLLCAQNRFPTYLDPSGIAGASAGPENNANNNGVLPQIPRNADLLDGAILRENAPQNHQGQIAENILDVTLNAAAAPYHQNQNVNGRLPDIGLGINENRLFGQPVLNGHPAPDAPVADPSLEPEEVDAADDVHPGAPEEIEQQRDEVDEAIHQEAPEVAVAQDVVAVQDEELPAQVDGPRDQLQMQLDSLQAMNGSLEEDLRRSRDELASQRSRLQEVEQSHSVTLEDVRKAGHDALSLVVEQYKEQTKTIIIEQQEMAKLQLRETLNEQMKAFQDLLAAQRQSLEQEKEREKEELQRKMDGAVQEACKQEQEKFQVFLKEEQENWKANMAKALEEERAVCQERIQEAVKVEHETVKTRLDEARAEYVRYLEEEKQTHQAALTKVREEEVSKAQEKMSELSREERERGRESVKEAVTAARADMRVYVDQRQQADSRVRQRHLTSLDLFLESARQQIGHLLESEKPVSPPNQPPLPDANGQS